MIDLHMHSVHSDGMHTVEEILSLAESRQLSAISLTDHNSVGAYGVLDACRDKFSGKIIPGVELNTTFDREIIEILGYGIDTDIIGEFTKKNCLPLPEKRKKEFAFTIKLYQDKGIVFDEDKLVFNPVKDTVKFVFYKEIIRHRENDKLFVYEESKYDEAKFMRNEGNNPDSPFFVDMTYLYPTIEDVVSVIHKAGGKAFLAHAYAYTPKIPASLDQIVSYGLDGLECIHSSFKPQQIKEITAYCDAHGLYKSGGSDFHGEKYRPDCIMGGLNIPESFCSDWYEQMKSL